MHACWSNLNLTKGRVRCLSHGSICIFHEPETDLCPIESRGTYLCTCPTKFPSKKRSFIVADFSFCEHSVKRVILRVELFQPVQELVDVPEAKLFSIDPSLIMFLRGVPGEFQCVQGSVCKHLILRNSP